MSAKKQPSLLSKPRSATAGSPALPSAALRNLRARLQVLKRPMVWGSLLLLLLPLLFLANYWNNLTREAGSTTANLPDASNSSSGATPESAPEFALGTAALPPLPDFLGGLLPGSNPNKAGDTRAQSSSQPAPSGKPAQQASTAAVPALPPIGITSTANRTAALTSGSMANSAVSSGNSTQGNSAQATVNPLQAALDLRAGVNSVDQTGSNAAADRAQSPAAQFGGTQSGNIQPGNIQSGNIQPGNSQAGNVTRIYEFGASTASQPLGPGQVLPGFGQPFVPQTSPAAGTTGYILPPALRMTGPATGAAPGPAMPQLLPMVPMLPQLPAGTSSNRAGGYSSPSPVPTVVAPAPQIPFSVPRVPPGRYIGNGEINTFSNP